MKTPPKDVEEEIKNLIFPKLVRYYEEGETYRVADELAARDWKEIELLVKKALTTHTDKRVREEREKAYMKGWTDCATGEMTFETQMTTEEAIKLFQQKGYPSLAKALKTLSDQPKDHDSNNTTNRDCHQEYYQPKTKDLTTKALQDNK